MTGPQRFWYRPDARRTGAGMEWVEDIAGQAREVVDAFMAQLPERFAVEEAHLH